MLTGKQIDEARKKALTYFEKAGIVLTKSRDKTDIFTDPDIQRITSNYSISSGHCEER